MGACQAVGQSEMHPHLHTGKQCIRQAGSRAAGRAGRCLPPNNRGLTASHTAAAAREKVPPKQHATRTQLVPEKGATQTQLLVPEKRCYTNTAAGAGENVPHGHSCWCKKKGATRAA